MYKKKKNVRVLCIILYNTDFIKILECDCDCKKKEV